MLHWQPFGRGPLGRPALNWTTKCEQFSRLRHWKMGRRSLQMLTHGWLRRTTSSNFVHCIDEFITQVVSNFLLFVLVHPLQRAARHLISDSNSESGPLDGLRPPLPRLIQIFWLWLDERTITEIASHVCTSRGRELLYKRCMLRECKIEKMKCCFQTS